MKKLINTIKELLNPTNKELIMPRTFFNGEITEAKTKLLRIIELEDKLKDLNRSKKHLENLALCFNISYSGVHGSGQFWLNEEMKSIIEPLFLKSIEMDIQKVESELNELTK